MSPAPSAVTRRGMAGLAGLAIGVAGAPLRVLAAIAPAPVVAFHMDSLYVDWTGRAEPYLPPLGLRAGAPVEHLDGAEIRRLQGWA